MAYQTIFGTSPVSEPNTSGFDSGIQVAVNREVDQGLGNLLVGVAQTAKQVTEFGTEMAINSAESDANDLLVQELEAMGPGGGKYLKTLKNRYNLANNVTNETVRNLHLSKLRTQLRTQHKGKKARAIIDSVFKNSIGTANPAGSIMDEATRTERAATATRLATHQAQLKAADAGGFTQYNSDGTVDEATTLSNYIKVKNIIGGNASAKSSLGSGGGGVVGTKFRGEHLATFNKIRTNGMQEIGLRIRSLLGAHEHADEIQKKVIAVQLGNTIEGMRSHIERQFTDKTGRYLTESELTYITEEPMRIWRSLTRGTELQGAWKDGKLVEGEQLKALNLLVGEMTKGRLNSYPSLRIVEQFKGVAGNRALEIVLNKIKNIGDDLKKAVASMDTNETDKLGKAFRALTDPKYLKSLGKEDKQLLGLPVKAIMQSGSNLVTAVKEEKGPQEASKICAGVIGMANECITHLDNEYNRDAMLEVLASENGVSLIDTLSKDPNNIPLFRKTIRLLNEDTARRTPLLVEILVEEVEDVYDLKLKKGDLVWTDNGIDFSDDAFSRIQQRFPDVTINDLGDIVKVPDKLLRRLGKFTKYVGPTEKQTNKKLSEAEWLGSMMERMFNAAIESSVYERGWFGWGGYPDSGFSPPIKDEDGKDNDERTSSIITNKPPKGVTKKMPKIRRVINVSPSK